MENKIRNLEFLRVVGILAIVMLHLFMSVYSLAGSFPEIHMYHETFFNMTRNGNKAVDLFFILSGFFFAYKLNTNKPLWEFIKKKVLRLYPVLIFVMLTSFIISLTGVFKINLYDYVLTLLGLSGTTLMNEKFAVTNVDQFWYVSSMLWAMALYYYLLKNYEKKNVNLFIAIMIFVCYSIILVGNSGKINSPSKVFFFIFRISMLRAFAGIGVGYFIGEWYKNNIDKIRNTVLNIKQILLVTVLEFMCVFFVINNLLLHRIDYRNDIIFIVVFIAVIMLFLCKKGIISNLLNNDIWVVAGRYTYSIFMVHVLLRNTFANTLWIHCHEWIVHHPVLNLSFTLAIIIILGVLTYHFVEKPCAEYIKNKNF